MYSSNLREIYYFHKFYIYLKLEIIKNLKIRRKINFTAQLFFNKLTELKLNSSLMLPYSLKTLALHHIQIFIHPVQHFIKIVLLIHHFRAVVAPLKPHPSSVLISDLSLGIVKLFL